MSTIDLGAGFKPLSSAAINIIPKIVVALIIFAFFYLVAKVIQRLVSVAMSRTSTAGHVDFVVGRLSYFAVLIFGTVAALSVIVNVTALVTSIGLAGFALGFGLKDVLSNSLSGILILIQRPFTIGDQIEVGGIEGQVEDVRVRDTVILTNEGKLAYVPNSKIFTDIITNVSANKKRLVTCPFSVDYSAELPVVREIALKSLTNVDGALAKPEPSFVVTNMEEKTAAELRFWIDIGKTSVSAAKSSVYLGIKTALDEAGIKISSGK